MKKLLAILLLVSALFPTTGSAFTLGIVADIHAGKERVRVRNGGNVIYPKSYQKRLKEFLKEKTDVVLTVGDNVNKSDATHTRKVAKLMKGRNVLWTKGNHDSEKSFRFLRKEKYYFYDRDNWRIIVLDTTDNGNTGDGAIGPAQMEWLRSALLTDKQVAIAMHHPMWNRDGWTYVIEPFQELERVMLAAGTVRYVFSGHYHTWNSSKLHNGIEYRFIPALSFENQANYVIMELN